jgi:glutamyl-tRNA synthetase
LEWLGIMPDESPWNRPLFRQSERHKAGLYQKYIDKLLASGSAYWAFDTPDKLDQLRAAGMSYNTLTRDNMSNTLTLSSERVAELIANGTPKVLRFKVPAGETVTITDEIRGVVRVETNTLDDKVLVKSDGMPTYHLANIADDIEMGVTHVIRGEEWLPSAPFHALVWVIKKLVFYPTL